jgi:hypothetical protein
MGSSHGVAFLFSSTIAAQQHAIRRVAKEARGAWGFFLSSSIFCNSYFLFRQRFL